MRPTTSQLPGRWLMAPAPAVVGAAAGAVGGAAAFWVLPAGAAALAAAGLALVAPSLATSLSFLSQPTAAPSSSSEASSIRFMRDTSSCRTLPTWRGSMSRDRTRRQWERLQAALETELDQLRRERCRVVVVD